MKTPEQERAEQERLDHLDELQASLGRGYRMKTPEQERAEQERLDHLDELQAEFARRYRMALMERALDGDEEAMALLLGQPLSKTKTPSLAGVVAKKAVKTIVVRAAAVLLVELLVPSLGTVAGKVIGEVADAIT
ncbi:MAG: hypothetical protein U0793_11240 [Gemmataceae bacterium]